ncbi:type I-E CRISPR-associated protein Cas5/CasD [Nitrosomonas sp. Nm58]|uniref:type I-E CRISPR-associated protein Cas5/CasD n=1 Tax=Nitrosomonas sp. Nm58 TaxID=200126 RepID=UPI0008944155|nr:type I-E CRISPR-associated protein Cas5/CasD [Nitrosomonas sp. Nm58]SDY50367.1 CRISPR system Cascade subunit CasD [Nitrosomonas sp. Nm58]
MPRYLILRLDGPMQAWGTHTFEDFRPSNLFPTRSGLLGLLGACLGIDRHNHAELEQLAASVEFTVRMDRTGLPPNAEQPMLKAAVKLSDFHTVLAARKVDGSPNKNPVVSRREYLFDAAFTVAIGAKPIAPITLEAIAEALRRPYFTPVLGRRSCPITRPLLEGAPIDASDAKTALASALPVGGLIYAEGDLESMQPLRIRDVPMYGRNRQFGTRQVYVHKETPCS